MKRDKSDMSSALLCVFCRLEQKQKHLSHDHSLDDYDRAALNDQTHPHH